jgi:copper chaperone CopZ
MTKTQLGVSGMHCESCARAVSTALGELSGVQSVKVDLKNGLATVKHSEPLDEELVSVTLENAGFSLK